MYRCAPMRVLYGSKDDGLMSQTTDHREWPVGACSGWQDDRQFAHYMLQRSTLPDPSPGLSARRLLVRPGKFVILCLQRSVSLISLEIWFSECRVIMFARFRYMPYVLLLATSKFARACGIYLSYDLLKFIHVIQLLFFIKAGYVAAISVIITIVIYNT